MAIIKTIKDKKELWSLYEVAQAFNLKKEFKEFKKENIRGTNFDEENRVFDCEDDFMLEDLLNKSDRLFWFESYDTSDEEFWRVIEFKK